MICEQDIPNFLNYPPNEINNDYNVNGRYKVSNHIDVTSTIKDSYLNCGPSI